MRVEKSMTKTSKSDSIVQGMFCQVVNYFRGKEVDDLDRLVQRGLSVIFKTEHLVQTGFEVDPDPFTANMFASSALAAINLSLRNYPFLRVDDGCPSEDRDATLASARGLIERAEGILARHEPAADKAGASAVEVSGQTFEFPTDAGDNAYFAGIGVAQRSCPLAVEHELGHGMLPMHSNADAFELAGFHMRISDALFSGTMQRHFAASDMEHLETSGPTHDVFVGPTEK